MKDDAEEYFVKCFNPKIDFSSFSDADYAALFKRTVRRINRQLNAVAKPYSMKARVMEPLVRSVGVQGDFRTYDFAAIVSGPYDTDQLAIVSNSIVNTVRGINRVVYQI